MVKKKKIKWVVVNKEYSEKQANGLKKVIKEMGNHAKIVKSWGYSPGGRRVRTFTVYEGKEVY